MRALSFRVLLPAALVLFPALAQAAVVRGPFLQQTSPRSTLVVLHTDAPAQAQVTASGGGETLTSESSQGTEHALRLEGLKPATTYEYQVMTDGQPAAGPFSFRTPGLPGTAAGRRAIIGVVGDAGSGGLNQRANAEQLKKRGVELLLTLGDNAYPSGAPGEWDPKFFEPLSAVLPSVTLAPALGDHEYQTPKAQGYLDAFHLPKEPGGERYYSFDWGDLHVISLDTNCITPRDDKSVVCGEEMVRWLEEDLARSQAPWKVVIMHRPAVNSGRYEVYPKIAKALPPVFEKGMVDLVLQGHDHHYERSWPLRQGEVVQRSYDEAQAPVYVVSGGSGDWIYEAEAPKPDWLPVREIEYQHLVLTLDGGKLTVESLRPNGSVLDSFALTQRLPEPTAAAPAGEPSSPAAPSGAPSESDAASPPEGEAQPLTETGQEPTPLGGCAAAPGPLVAVALLVPVLRRRRRTARTGADAGG